jgi:nondiscriminating glutamyl-tRNA synthetase
MDSGEFKFQKPGEVRTRFAPAPTGFLHIGAARTALFNYLFAKKHKGVFILRIEDTDIERSEPKYENDILKSLKWLGVEWDEGPDIGGDYGPYRQSKRLKIYTQYLEKLLTENKAYYCFCPEEELEDQRQYCLSIGETPRYSGRCANLSKEEVEKLRAAGKPSVIRFRVPAKKIEFNDLIREKLEFDTSLIGDIVIAKNLTTPLYNFACVVDDFENKVSHIIRGEEHISNTPKQILLQEALNLPSPQYAHLPIILAPDRTKLSKRHGATGILEYKEEGYLPEALVNFMAFLGWNPGGEREIYSMPSLIKEFSIEKVQKGGAIFNIKRLNFLNSFYIRQRSVEKSTELCLPYLVKAGLIEELKPTAEPSLVPGRALPEKGKELKKDKVSEKQSHGAQLFEEKGGEFKIKATGEIIDLAWLQKIVLIYQERLKKLSEISELTEFFFKEKLEYEKNLLRWPRPEALAQEQAIVDKETKVSLDKSEKILSKIKPEDWDKENLEKVLIPEAEKFSKELGRVGDSSAQIRETKTDRGYLLWPLRVALSGKEASAGPFELAEILGKEKTIKRIKEAKELL